MAKYITEWKAKELKDAIRAQLAENAQLVGKVVEADARRRLDAIESPDDKRSVNWRWFLSKYVLTHKVTTEEDEVVIEVGMKMGPGKGGATRGLHIELGSAAAPAHPFLRPAVWQNMRDILRLLTKGK